MRLFYKRLLTRFRPVPPFCHWCGRDADTFSTALAVWRLVARQSAPIPLCVACFVSRARALGFESSWALAVPDAAWQRWVDNIEARPTSICVETDGWLTIGGLRPERRLWRSVIKDDPCGYCGGVGGTVDHIVAKTRGGWDTWENFSGACRSCNYNKGTMSLLQFLHSQKRRRDTERALSVLLNTRPSSPRPARQTSKPIGTFAEIARLREARR